METTKAAICFFIKGYEYLCRYGDLIGRNKALQASVPAGDAGANDMLVFYEGNISEVQVKYIWRESVLLPLRFTNESEKVVQKAMDNALSDRTAFVVAHRLSAFKNAERIIFFDKGRVDK